MALFLAAATLTDIVRWQLAQGPLSVPGPYTGTLRPLYHLEQAGFLLWPFGLLAAAVKVYATRSQWPVAVAYVATVATLAATYPAVRGDRLGTVYAVAWLACSLAALACAGFWTRRREHPQAEHVVVLLMSLMSLGIFAPGSDSFFDWQFAQKLYIVIWLCVAGVQGAALMMRETAHMGLVNTGSTFNEAVAGSSGLRRRRAGEQPFAYRVDDDDDGEGDGDAAERSEVLAAPRDPASAAEILTPAMRRRVTLWLRRLGVPARDREDLAQEVLLTAYLLFEPAKVGDTGAPGLVNLIARRAADHYHRKVRHSREEVLDLSMLGREDGEGPSIDVPPVEAEGPEHDLLRREAALQVQAILQALSPEDRSLLAAIFLRELQVKEYAAKYDIELHTAYRERDRALERARALAARVLRVFGRKAR